MSEPCYSTSDLMSQGVAVAGITRVVGQVMVGSNGKRFTDEGKTRGAIARDVLPPVPYVQLPQAVCQLCAAQRKVADGHAEDQLLAIAADGRVDEMEERQFVELTEELDDVIAAALALRYAEGGVRAWN